MVRTGAEIVIECLKEQDSLSFLSRKCAAITEINTFEAFIIALSDDEIYARLM